MKLSDLVTLVADLTGIHRATIRETARALQKDGLIGVGKPGRYGGADMRAEDAAALSIALMTTTGEHRAVTSIQSLVREIAEMKMDGGYLSIGDDNTNLALVAADLHLDPRSMFFDIIVRLIANPTLGFPEGDLLTCDVEVEFPSNFAVLKAQVRSPGDKEFHEAYIVFSNDKTLELGGHHYSLTRTLRNSFFMEMNRALFGGEPS